VNTPFLYPGLIFLFLLLSVFFAGSETALMAVNRLKLKVLAESGDTGAAEVKKLISNTDRLLGVVLLGNTLSNIAAASLVTYVVASYAPADWVEELGMVSTIVLTIIVLIFCELTPKIIAAGYAEQVARLVVRPMGFFLSALAPFTALAAWVSGHTVRLLGLQPNASPFAHAPSEEEVRAVIASASPAGIAEEKKEMLHKVFEIGATQVRGVMIPRTEVTSADLAAPVRETLQLIARTHYSRIPVYRGTFDNIVGILYVKDLLPLLDRPSEIRLHALLRPVHFVPDTARLEIVLQQLQSMHLHMAVVVDEFGGVEGVVTLEDLLEEIVGEIRDEHDTEIESIRSLGPELYSVAGNLPVKDFNRFFGVKIPDNPQYTTIVGFLQSRTGRLMHEGENVRFQQVTFSIEKVEGFKTISVRVRVPSVKAQDAPEPAATR
jgi:putative hemolysin